MMKHRQVLERLGLPTVVTSCNFGYPIFHPALDRLVSANLLETFATEKLRGASYAFRACLVLDCTTFGIDLKNPAADNAKIIVALKMLEQCFEVSRSERDVRIQVTKVAKFSGPYCLNCYV